MNANRYPKNWLRLLRISSTFWAQITTDFSNEFPCSNPLNAPLSLIPPYFRLECQKQKNEKHKMYVENSKI